MTNQNSIKLNLFQPLVYQSIAIEDRSDIEKNYKMLLKKIEDEPTGCEGVMKFSYLIRDNVKISLEEMGYAEPPTEEVREAVLNGEEIPLYEHNMEIPEGRYMLAQYPIAPESNTLFSMFIPFICNSTTNKKGTFHFRLLKENALVILSQIILKLEE